MTQEELIARIHTYDNGISRLVGRREDAYAELLDIICPYKIGDIAEVKGYAFKGMCKIVNRRIVPSWWNANEYGYEVSGIVIKQDGSAGVRGVKWTGREAAP